MPIEQSRDANQLAAFELSGWDMNICGYDSAFGAVARQTVGAMRDAASVKRGTRVLDILRPGPRAAERDAEAIGLDFPQRRSNSPASPIRSSTRLTKAWCAQQRCFDLNPRKHATRYVPLLDQT